MHSKVVRSREAIQTPSLPGCVFWIWRQTSLIQQNKGDSYLTRLWDAKLSTIDSVKAHCDTRLKIKSAGYSTVR